MLNSLIAFAFWFVDRTRLLGLCCASVLLIACQPTTTSPPIGAKNWLTEPFREPGQGRIVDIQRLHAALSAEPSPTGEYHFRLLRRLGTYLSYSTEPDSAGPILRHALRVGQPFARQVPLETATILSQLARAQWDHHAFDSARYYHLRAARLLRLVFPDSTHAVRPYSIDGKAPQPAAIAMAEHYCNAGMAAQALGELPQALQCYERGRRAYQWAADLPGLAWVHTLFAEALQDQHQQARAAQHFEQALGLLRRQARLRPDRAAQEWASILALYAPDLQTQHPARLRQLAKEGQSLLSAPLLAHPGDRDLLASATKLTLFEAKSYPRLARVPIHRGEGLLRRFRAAAGHDYWAALGYYPAAATLAALSANQAHLTGQTAVFTHYSQAALANRDSIAEPWIQARTTLELAQWLVHWRAFTPATRELQKLLSVYKTADQTELQTAYTLLTQAYAGANRLDSAYVTQSRAMALNEQLRNQAQQATLADAETRYRTRLQAARIEQLTQATILQQHQSHLAWLSAGLLLLLLTVVGYALLVARRLNRRLHVQHRQIEEQAEYLAELDQSKSRFFANISHELRTPLTLVLGPVDHLLTQENLSASIRQRLVHVQRSGQRLQGLVNNILDLTKLEAGQLRLHLAPIQITALLRRVVEPFQTLASQRSIGLTLRGTLPDKITLLLDAEQIEQVLGNLLANALRHTPDGGHIEVYATAAESGFWQLEVQDNGPGVALEERTRIFERFYQSQRHRMEGGTGIGLALSRELAQLMGGTLTVDDAPQEGARFCFRFQAAVAASVPLEPNTVALASALVKETGEIDSAKLPNDSAYDKTRPRVLLVEDHAELRMYMRGLLAQTYQVCEAASGQEAVIRLAEQSVDLIISDEMMPGMSGTELLRHLQQQADWQAVPFLLVTARADLAHRLLALDIGVADYLGKPFVAAELLARVRNLLRNQAERRRYQAVPDAEPASAEFRTRTAFISAPEALAPVVELPIPTASDAELLARLRATIECNLADEDFSPARLAFAVELSERTLYRRLKELTGLTPAAYVREVRLLHARHLLETRAVTTVSEAAFAVGFANASHFSRVYAERFGRSPGEDKA